MKINEIVTEHKRTNAEPCGNDAAKIARNPKDATSLFNKADKGAQEKFNAKKARKKVRDMYGVELVDDFVDVLELPNAEGTTDKEMSMFSKDNR